MHIQGLNDQNFSIIVFANCSCPDGLNEIHPVVDYFHPKIAIADRL